MDKEQAYHSFWSGFGVETYDENTVPEDAGFPRITYEVSTDSFGSKLALTASIWDYNKVWKRVVNLEKLISETISYGGKLVRFDGGAFWIKRGTPFSQRSAGSNDMIRRIIINVEVEFISEV